MLDRKYFTSSGFSTFRATISVCMGPGRPRCPCLRQNRQCLTSQTIGPFAPSLIRNRCHFCFAKAGENVARLFTAYACEDLRATRGYHHLRPFRRSSRGRGADRTRGWRAQPWKSEGISPT